MFMSFNGMSEAFAYGQATPSVMTTLQGMLFFNSILYIGSVIVFSKYFGIVGLIYANCLNMGVRAIFSLKISLDEFTKARNIQDFGLFQLTARIFCHKVFIGLVTLGCFATFVVKICMDHLIVYL